MNYQETIDYLFTKLPMYSRTGAAAYKSSLDNIITLCQFLENPQNKFKSVHIAGTNGKGSASNMLAAIFQTEGYKTGLHTSPHLKDYRERITVNSFLVEEEFVIDFAKKIKKLITKIQPSFFEISVAMAFDYFAQQEVDIAIIETGLGGNLDSTNIIQPEISIITNIGWDHMDLLGNTLEKIATEKAGIIKKETPIVIGEYTDETKLVFVEKAINKNAPISFASDNWKTTSIQNSFNKLDFTATSKNKTYNISSDLNGIYQVQNIITVLESVDILQKLGWKISDKNMIVALSKVKTITGFKGRWDILKQNPLVIADVAHNVNGIEFVLKQLEQIEYSKLHIITGLVKDKDIEKVLQLFPTSASYYFTQADIPRALDKEVLKEKAAAFNLKGATYNNVNKAIEKAINSADKDDLILICGSIFLVAEIDESII